MRLLEQYQKQIVPEMMKKFGYKSPMAAPKIEKVVVNSGFGMAIIGKSGSEREKLQNHIKESLSLITGQMAAVRKAKRSIAGFKLRQGMAVGAQVTLRGKRAYQFLEKLIKLVLPRVRDFRGIPLESVTERGDVSVGFKEITPFPELKIEREKALFGLEISVVTTAQNKEEGVELLRLLGFPLKKQSD